MSYGHGGSRLRSPFRHLSDAEYIDACVADLRDVIEATTAGDIACLIPSRSRGLAGFAVPPDGLFGAFAKVLDEYGILYVSDEVQTGWGRTGEHFWGYEAHGVMPDLLTFAKGIGNGLAIGGVVGRGDLVDSVTANSISTFGGNPLASAGALANLEYLLSHDLQANARARGEQLLDRLAPAAVHPHVGELRGRGLMVALEMVRPGTVEPDAGAADELLEGTRRRGLLIGRGGLGGNVLRIAPPLSVTRDEADRAADIILETLSELSG